MRPSGTLTKKIVRQDDVSTSHPPSTGPSAVVRAEKPAQVPIARPLSFSRKTGADDREALRHHQSAADLLQGARADERADIRRAPARDRSADEDDDAEVEHASPAVAIARRAADQNERAEREHVAVRNPLRAAHCGVQRTLNCRQSDTDDGAVDERHARR